MPEIQPIKILSVSSEDYSYPARNLLKGSSSFQWCCKNLGENEAYVEFQVYPFNTFEERTKFTRIELGNNSSGFIEIQVSKFSSMDSYQVLLGSTALMTPTEALKCEGLKRVRCFKELNFTKASLDKWDIVKIICTQPFNKILQYGLSFIRFFGEINYDNNPEGATGVIKDKSIDLTKFLMIDSENSDNWKPGSLFTMRNKSDKSEESTSNSFGTKEINLAEKTEANCKEISSNNLPSNQHSSQSPSSANYTKIVSENITESTPKHVVKRKYNETGLCDHSDRVSGSKLKKSMDQTNPNELDRPKSRLKESGRAKPINDESSPKNPVQEIEQHKSLSTDSVTKHFQTPNDGASTSASGPSADTSIFAGVVFVLSGYQNPSRNNLRDKALSLGAQYRCSWTDDCTHLICAFSNTPKFREVSGRGIIVTDKWISDCYNRKQMLPWRQYRLKGAPSPDKSIIPNNPNPSRTLPSGSQTTPSESISSGTLGVVATDTDSQTTFPGVLNGKHIFLHGCFDDGELRFLTRWIETFGGTLHQYMDPQVTIIITDAVWTSEFNEVLRTNPGVQFVRSAWLRRCDEAGCQVPLEDFEVHE